jgi:flagellar motor switch protein FliM
MLTDEALQRLIAALKPSAAPQPDMPEAELRFLFEKLAEELTPALQSIVPISECSFEGQAFVRYSSALNSTDPALYVLARQNEQPGFVLVRLGAVAVEWWLTRSLGGQSSPRTSIELSQISKIGARVGRIAIDLTLGTLARILSSWSVDVAFQECKLATERADLPNPQDDPMVERATMRIAPDAGDAKLELFIAEPLWGKWSEAAKAQTPRDDSATQAKPADSEWQDVFSHTLEAVPVVAEAILCQQEVDLSEVAEWRPGKVVPLEVTSEKLVDLMSGEMTLLRGVLGKRDGRLCLRVSG